MVIVLGSTNLDQVGHVTRLPKPGEAVAGGSFTTSPGGKGANQALAARRAGAEVRFHSAVGRDVFAEEALACLRADGVDLAGVTTAPTHTGIAMILVDAEGENVIAVLPGANASVSPDHVARALEGARKGDILLLQQEVPVATNHLALDAARKAGLRTILNIAPYLPETPDLAAKADILIANETEFELLAGEDGMDAAGREAALNRLHGETGQTIIVTLGADGVIAARAGALHRSAGLKIEPVDTVGAGDTFCGYFAASLADGLDFPAALRRAAVAGSLACLKAGAQPSIPVAEDVAKRL